MTEAPPTAEQVEDSGFCCMHVAVEDVNLEDHNLEFCLKYADEKGCPSCVRIATWLLAMSFDERARWFDANGLMCNCCRERNGL